MRKNAIFWALLSLLFYIVVFPSNGASNADAAKSNISENKFHSQQHQIRIGILAFRDKPNVNDRWKPIEDRLNSASDDVSYNIIPMYYKELEDAVKNGSIDYLISNPAFYIYLYELYGLSSPLLTLLNKQGEYDLKKFGGVIFTDAKNKSFNTLDDLYGAKAAVVSRQSLGGFQMQVYEISQYRTDITEKIEWVVTGMPHDHTVTSVLTGNADIGFARTGILEKMEQEGKISWSDLRIINPQKESSFPLALSTSLYPEWPVASLSHSDQEITKSLLVNLLGISGDDEIATRMQIGGFDIPENYASVENLMRAQRFPPFDKSPQVRLGDIWNNHSTAVILLVLLLTVLFVAYVGLFRLQKKLLSTRKELIEEKQNLTEIIWATQVGTWAWNINTSEFLLNDMWAQMLGYELHELQPFSIDVWYSLVHKDDISAFEETLRQHLSGNTKQYQTELRMKHKNGHWVWILSTGKVVESDTNGKPFRLSGTHSDITSRKEDEADREAYSKRLEMLATRDSLTNLHNRRYFMESGSKLFEVSRRYKHHLSSLMIDADDFKLVNDSHGHSVGDNVLVTIARILESNIRQADLLARIGGEEFAILMPDTDSDKALSIANRIISMVNQEVIYAADVELKFSVSIGVAERTDDISSVGELINLADKALYRVKESGKGFAKSND